MDWIREYLLRLICTALLCGIANGLLGKRGTLGTSVKLITGIMMVLTFASPWMNLQISDTSEFFGGISTDADSFITDGQKDAREALETIIKSKTEAYILDKAKSFGAELTVEVRLDGSELPVPCAVRVSGSISPYGKKQLCNIITNELGIALEDQTWTG